MIQIITYDVRKFSGYLDKDKIYKISKLAEIQAFDDFEICIIDLTDENLWQYNGTLPSNINDFNDLITLKEAIINCKNATVLIVFPQNINFYYNREYEMINGNYKYNLKKYVQLKDNKNNLVKIINENLINIEDVKIVFEKTKTVIGDKEVEADFNFNEYKENFEIVTTSKNSNKVTTIKRDNLYFTTLNILTTENILNLFIKNYCKQNNQKEEKPEWIKNVFFYNDRELEEKMDSNNKKIEEFNNKNSELKKELDKNLKYKSILYTNGEELVQVVLEILDELLDFDSSQFIDEKREDFLIKKEDITFVGEIKGLSSSVQNKNVSQLENHVQGYFDKLQEEGKEENVKGLLVINHQRTKRLEDRQKVHKNQIDLALRYGILIVETQVLLKIYEQYKFNNITKEECKELFKQNIGLLEFEK